ncbi:MAG TPA: hypothetical protein VKL40_11180 [Candidatus Angelobacter sp.]|nr:hypothetical protein [Candidatus Angelobacter sp.]
MNSWKNIRIGLSILTLALLSGGCGSGDPPDPMGNEIELQARAQALINGMEAELDGQFRVEAEGQRLRGELDKLNLAIGTPVSFCLRKSSGTVALAAPVVMQSSGDELAQFELNTENGQTVPTVVAGDTLEARQGANASGTADCGKPLLVSAVFQAEVNQPHH